jgi:hypothetical protein
VLAAGSLAAPSFAQAETRSISANETLPMRQIVLYRSGVGYFERRGSVRGDAEITLTFDADQINDILKSLIVADMGGTVESVGYASKEPLERRLGGFAIDLSDADSMVGLIKQLRGAEVVLDVQNAGTLRGSVLGVEERQTVTPAGNDAAVIREPYVTLSTAGGVRSAAVSRITALNLADPELADELARALQAVAESRTDRTKTVEVRVSADDDQPRDVVAAYVHETPVWKTSYRLMLPDDSAGASMGDVMLSGWAIVENTTDSDWENVTLSLASGRPVGFTMDLYEPLFMARPEVPVPVERGVASRTYEGGREVRAVHGAAAGRLPMPRPGQPSGDIMQWNTSLADENAEWPAISFRREGAAATGAEVGEQFMYQLDMPVTIERQRSAMLPIVATPVEGRRVSIYTPLDNANHPMRGVQFDNTSGLHLLPGPIAVYDGSAFAGDAQIPHTSRGEDRLLSYALDLDVRAEQSSTQRRDVQRIRIVNGLIETTTLLRNETSYTFDVADTGAGRTLLVEHPRPSGWELVTDERLVETTPNVWRLELSLEPDEERELRVVEERTERQTVAVGSMDLEELLAFNQRGKASDEVLDAVRTAAELQSRINEAQRSLNAIDDQRRRINNDQSRIRDNMARIDRDSDLYRRYMSTLSDQEDRLNELEQQRDRLEDEKRQAEKELRDFLANLNVN